MTQPSDKEQAKIAAADRTTNWRTRLKEYQQRLDNDPSEV